MYTDFMQNYILLQHEYIKPGDFSKTYKKYAANPFVTCIGGELL